MRQCWLRVSGNVTSVLFPAKIWFAPDQPLNMTVRPNNGAVTLVLTDFTGKPFDPRGDVDVAEEKNVNLKEIFGQLSMPGTYVLFAVPKDAAGDISKFVGTPLVIGVRDDKRREAATGPMVVKVEPMRFAVISTERGDMTCARREMFCSSHWP